MNKSLFSLILICLALTACRGSKHLDKTTSTPAATTATTPLAATAAEAESAARTTAALSDKASHLTASVKVSINAAGKDLSVSGRLQMKRDDVVRLSLRFIGMEVGVLEFTPADVLVVDRVNKQYVRAQYDEVSFLRAAGLDFYALQALFWDELFVPGTRQTSKALARFALTRTAEGPLLSLTDTPRLRYDFLIDDATHAVARLAAKGQKASDKGSFAWTYGEFATFAGRPFPHTMQMTLTGTGRDLGLSLSLSSLKQDSDWNTRTTVSAKYTRKTAKEVLGALHLN